MPKPPRAAPPLLRQWEAAGSGGDQLRGPDGGYRPPTRHEALVLAAHVDAAPVLLEGARARAP
eukprot:7149604-Alexandrium_andersonii.AAC.1